MFPINDIGRFFCHNARSIPMYHITHCFSFNALYLMRLSCVWPFMMTKTHSSLLLLFFLSWGQNNWISDIIMTLFFPQTVVLFLCCRSICACECSYNCFFFLYVLVKCWYGWTNDSLVWPLAWMTNQPFSFTKYKKLVLIVLCLFRFHLIAAVVRVTIDVSPWRRFITFFYNTIRYK